MMELFRADWVTDSDYEECFPAVPRAPEELTLLRSRIRENELHVLN